jgi:hypothetical protein
MVAANGYKDDEQGRETRDVSVLSSYLVRPLLFTKLLFIINVQTTTNDAHHYQYTNT